MATEPSTPEEFLKILGPPNKTQQAVEDIAGTTSTIKAAFNKCLAVPDIDKLKVDDSEKQVSIGEQVKTLQAKYVALEDLTLPIVRGLLSFSEQQKLLLPYLDPANKQSISADLYLRFQLPRVQQYAQEARLVAKKTNGLRDECADFLKVLRQSLANVQSRIEKLEKDVRDKEREYSTAKWTAIAKGILAGLLMIGAIILFFNPVTWVGAGAVGLGAASLIASMTSDAINAGNLSGAIAGLKGLLREAQKTRDTLNELIPAFEQVVTMMSQISGIWDDLETNLSSVKDSMQSWRPGTFGPQMVEPTIQSWIKTSQGLNDYISAVVAPIGASATMLATTMSVVSVSQVALNSMIKMQSHEKVESILEDSATLPADDDFSEPPPKYSLLDAAPKAAQVSFMLNMSQSLMQSLAAPSFAPSAILSRIELLQLDQGLGGCVSRAQRLGHAFGPQSEAIITISQRMSDMINARLLPGTVELMQSLSTIGHQRPRVPQIPVADWVQNDTLSVELWTEGGAQQLAKPRNILQDIGMTEFTLSRAMNDLAQAMMALAQQAESLKQDAVRSAVQLSSTGAWLFPIVDIARLMVERTKAQEMEMMATQGQEALAFMSRVVENANEVLRRYRALVESTGEIVNRMAETRLEPFALLKERPDDEVKLARVTWEQFAKVAEAW